jgi:hypothetical protein
VSKSACGDRLLLALETPAAPAADVRPVSVTAPSKPDPGAIWLPTIRPSASAMTVITRK